jgi:hypothetical protein
VGAGGDPGHQVAFQQAYMVLLAVVSTLLSRSLSASATDERDDSALGQLTLTPVAPVGDVGPSLCWEP